MDDCLEDQGVELRVSDDGNEITMVNPLDPAVVEASEFCFGLTQRPADDSGGSTDYGNAITLAVADCLVDRGYAVDVSGDSELVGQDGSEVVTFSVPDAQRDTNAYRQDENECFALAQAAIPSATA